MLELLGVQPRIKWDVIEVTEKATGNRIKIKGHRFNPALHEQAKVLEDRTSKPVEIKMDDPDPWKPITTVKPEVRFEFLKNKGWAKLDKAERANYQELKKQLGK